MDDMIQEAEEILGTPNKCFSLTGISEDDGSLIDVKFNFRQFKEMMEFCLPDHSGVWMVVPKERCSQYGIQSKSPVKFHKQTLIEIHNRGIFTDCIWLENRIREYSDHLKSGGREQSARKKFILDIMSRMKKVMQK